MKIKRGHTRIVLLIPLLGIAIKIAKINFFKGLNRLFIEPLYYKNLRNCWLWFYYQLIHDSQYLDTFRYYWFRGIKANWSEFNFYLKSKHLILQPTYFSFFGLFNIQKIGQVKLKKDTENQFYHLTAGKARGHTFSDLDNFCLENEQLIILDYGDNETQEIIRAVGDQLLQFDPNWDYEEYKKRRTQKPSSANQSDA